MSVVIYKCDTCDRKKIFPRNESGMEHIGRCNITLGCRGNLMQTKIISGYFHGDITESVYGLEDWYPRRILYEHKQTINSQEWIVNHGLGTDSAVNAFINDPKDPSTQMEKIPKKITIIDRDNLKLEFDYPCSGIAQLIARQSDPNLFKPNFEEIVKEDELIPITKEYELSICTKISTLGDREYFRIKLTYALEGETLDVIHDMDDNPSYISPWNDYDKVSIKGKMYRVRSFNILHEEMAKGKLIGPGAAVYFSVIDNGDSTFRNIESDDVIILLTNKPYENVDKNPNIYIDAYDAKEFEKESLIYDNGAIYAVPEIVNSIYPPIRKI